MKNLKYRVYSVSSEDEYHRATNLLQSLPQGWQTQKCGQFPQELTLQFYVPIRTKNIKLTFHQYKIPKLVQVFVKCMKNEKYRKLGFIQPSDNSQSDYLHKEIKTIFFEFPCSFIKLIFHQNHKNQMNLFDQVGLSDVSVQGEMLSANELRDMEYSELDALQTEEQIEEEEEKPQVKYQNPSSSNSNTGTFHSLLFPDFIAKLESAKREAVERQDFQQASQIKNTISNFRDIQNQIKKLQNEKRVALEDEDFDKCHKLKNEINRKKEMAEYQISQFAEYINNPGQSRVSSRSSYTTNKQFQHHIHHEQEPIINSPTVSRQKSPQYLNDYESQVVPALRNKSKQQQQFPSASRINESLDDVHFNQNIQNSLINQSHQGNISYHQNPSTVRKQQEQVEEYEEKIPNLMFPILQKYQQLEELDLKIKLKLQQYFHYISELLWRMALSKKYWRAKVDALQEIIQYKITDKQHMFALLQFVAITIQDKHTVSAKYTLIILQNIIKAEDVKFQYSHTPYYIQNILNGLINMMNQTSQQLRKSAISIYQNLPQICMIQLHTVVHTLIRYGSSKNKKLTPIKLDIIEVLIEKYIDIHGYFEQITKWLVGFLDDPSQKIRKKVTNLLIQVANRTSPQFIMKFVQSIKDMQIYQSFLAILHNSSRNMGEEETDRNKFITDRSQLIDEDTQYKRETIMNKHKKKIDGEPDDDNLRKIQQSPIPSPDKILRESEQIQLAYSQQSIFPDNSQSHEWFARQNQIKVMEVEEGDQDHNICDYCFGDLGQETIQDHILYTCPVVIPCQICSAYIYLRQLTQHLLHECQKAQYVQCPKCQLAFEVTQINEHRAQSVCKQRLKGWERCQLCGRDVDEEDEAWVEHSLACKQKKIKSRPQIE